MQIGVLALAPFRKDVTTKEIYERGLIRTFVTSLRDS